MASRYRVMQLGSPTGLYGAERWILALVGHLNRDQVEISVAVVQDEPGPQAPLYAEALRRGVEAHVLQAFGRVNFSAVSKLRNLIRDRKVDILHTHGYKTDLIGLLAVCGTSCRLITTPHGWSTQAGPKLRLYEALDRMVFPFFDAVVPLSDRLYEGLRKLPFMSRRLHLIRNGVDITEIDAATELAPEALLWRQAGDFVVGYIGQLISRKGLDVLLRSFAALDVPAKRLVLLGDGPQRQELEDLTKQLGIADRVHFLGFRTDRLLYLKAFDVFALPSRLEGIPRCLMESMAAGVAIVASDIPGCADLVTHNRTGLLVPVDAVVPLTLALSRLRDADLRRRLTVAGREHVAAVHSAGAMALQYQQLYEQLLGQ
jgi:glycosyltransferase involved in cell wall biosynthesis